MPVPVCRTRVRLCARAVLSLSALLRKQPSVKSLRTVTASVPLLRERVPPKVLVSGGGPRHSAASIWSTVPSTSSRDLSLSPRCGDEDFGG